ncbi:MAG: 3TM-type holin [Pseudomonadota bacterium]
MFDMLLGPITSLLDKVIEDKDQKSKLAHEIATLAQKQAHAQVMAQVEVNKVEAASNSLFVAGWRPAIGWICGLAFAWHFVLEPMAEFTLAYIVDKPPSLPSFDMAALMTVLMGMLGLGGLRTYEKKKGIDKPRVSMK